MAASFEGKVVVITGANSGIGETALRLFGEAGATVYGTARKQEALDAAKARHPKARWLLADVNNPAQVRTAFERIEKEAGRIDVLVNNAAIFTFGPLAQSNDDMVRAQFETNVVGLSKAAALEVARDHIRVNVVAPGPTLTPMLNRVTDGHPEAFAARVPIGRAGTPEEQAEAIVWLASPAASFVNGVVLDVMRRRPRCRSTARAGVHIHGGHDHAASLTRAA